LNSFFYCVCKNFLKYCVYKIKKTQYILKTKTYNLNISKQIDVNFRNYALYVLENRGIPSFDDGLTNVQRFVLVNAPTSFNKTISLVGKCIADGYHHGDCLSEETIIHLADGSTITIGNWFTNYPDAELLVSCYDEANNQFTHSIGHSPRIGQETNEIYEVELENGEMFKMTGNHPVYTQRGWVQAKDLLESDSILQKP